MVRYRSGFFQNKISVWLFLVLMSTIFFSYSCSNDSSSMGLSRMEKSLDVGRQETSFATAESGLVRSPQDITSEDSKIQVTGNISLVVQSVDESITEVHNLVARYGGKVTSSTSGESYGRYANMTLLIPKDSFYELVKNIKEIATKVTNENIYSNDVTEEYIDIEARLNVMKKTEKRFTSLLSDSKKIEEIINVERELMRIRGDIDSLEGRIKYLSRTTQNSILNLHITKEESITGNQWSFSESLDNSIRSLVSLSKHIASFLISLIVFSPVIVCLLILSFIAYKLLRRGKIRGK